MDEYRLDGLYDDLGYVPLHSEQPMHGSHISPGRKRPRVIRRAKTCLSASLKESVGGRRDGQSPKCMIHNGLH